MTRPLFAHAGHAAAEGRDGRGVSLEVDALVDHAEAGVLLTCHELGLDLRLEPAAARRLAAALELAATVVVGR